jgi:acyl-coenzyme A synthetase/AMP-(fatty) acid ligase
VTYHELINAFEAVARRAAALGLHPKEPVGVYIEDPARQLTVTLALLGGGWTVSPIHAGLIPYLSSEGFSTLISDSAGRALVEGKTIAFDQTWFAPLGAASTANDDAPIKPNDEGQLATFTSGTTGTPKKLIRTVTALYDYLQIYSVTGQAKFSRTFVGLGIGSAWGFTHSWATLSAGKTVFFSKLDEQVFMLISGYRINYLVLSARQARHLVELVEKTGGYQLDSLMALNIGGGLLTSELARRIQANLCPKIILSYGSTEAGTVAFGSYDMIAKTPGAVGFVMPWAAVETVDDNGVVLPSSVEGRIRCRTPLFVQNTVANRPDADISEDEMWWYPGDTGRVTAENILCIVGRDDDVINLGGVKTAAMELEELLLSCPGIADAGICTVMSIAGINEAWAGIVTAANFEIDIFMQSLERDRKLKEKFDATVSEVIIVEQIPRTPMGKIQRNELRELLLQAKAAS